MNKKNTLLLVSFLLITSIAFSNDNETFFFENDIFSQIKRTINNAETVNATVTIDFSGAIASPYQEDFYEVSPSAGGNSISYAANATTTHTYSAVSGTPTVTLVSFDLYSASSNGSHTVTIGGETLATNTLGWNTYTIADFPGSPDWVFESGTFTISVFEALFNDVAIDNIVLTDIAPAADTTPPVITLNTPTIQTIEVGTAYSELGATATDNVDAANTLNVTPTVINENTAVVGSFTVDYNVSDAAGNAATKVTRTVNVVDTTAPVITSSVLVQEIDEGGTALGQFFANETVTWSINDYNNLGLEISTDGFVTITAGAVIGNQYYYDVTATDVSPNINHSTSIQTIVTVNDITAPVIALNTPTIQTIEVGAAYSELGATATDNVDAANTLTVIPTVNNENTAVVGSFTVDYNVSDAAGNAATEVTRTVNVVDTTAPTVVTKDITVQLDANGNASITAGDIDNGSSDNSGQVSLSISQNNFDCDDITATQMTYSSLTNQGWQNFPNELGLDFNLLSSLAINSLGAFDHNSDGINGGVNGGVRVAIFNRDTQTIVPNLDVTISGSDDPLVNNYRVRSIAPVILEAGQYSVVAKGYGPDELNGNGTIIGATDDANGTIEFVGGGRNGNPDVTNNISFPTNIDIGPANIYMIQIHTSSLEVVQQMCNWMRFLLHLQVNQVYMIVLV